jgi:tetratricopeptide (TPR) repeat protein
MTPRINSKRIRLALVLLFAFSLFVSVAFGDTEKAKEHFNNGLKMTGEKKDSAAIEEYKLAIKEDPQYLDAHINLGSQYFKAEKFSEAEANFLKATEIDPKNADALANLGRTYYKLNKNTEAEASYKSALANKADYYEIHKDLGLLYVNMNNWPGLVDNMKIYTEKIPTDFMGFYLLGKGNQSLKKYPDAIAAYNKSMELNKDYFNSYNSLGQIYQAQENYPEALKMFEKVVTLRPDNYLAHYNLAIAFEHINPDKVDQVIANWNKFLKAAKNNPKAQKLIPATEEHLKELEAQKAKK